MKTLLLPSSWLYLLRHLAVLGLLLGGPAGSQAHRLAGAPGKSAARAAGRRVSFAVLPTVVTQSAAYGGGTYATFAGSVTSGGDSPVSQRGFVYGTNATPTLGNSNAITNNGGGNLFTATVSLSRNTTYYVRAYATNATGTAYGNTLSLTTPNPRLSTPTDANTAPNVVAENAAPGTSVGITVTSSDPYTGSPAPATLLDDAGGRFVLDNSSFTGGVVRVASGAGLDFETATSYTIVVQALYPGSLALNSDPQSFTIQLTDVDEFAPVVTTTAGLTVAPELVTTVVDAGVTVSDADGSQTLASATVRVSSGLVSSQDLLSFTPVGNITGSYDTGTGTLTLTSPAPNASLAQWQAALRSVSYRNTSAAPTGLSRTLSFVVNSGTLASAPASKTVVVQDVSNTVVSSFAPVSGPAGTLVTLMGTGFGGATAVRFGNINAPSFTVVSSTSLTVTVPAGVVLAPITVVAPSGVSRYGGSDNGLFASVPCVAGAQLTPAGPLTLPAGGSATLTATATTPGFNAGGSGFDGTVQALVVQPDGKVLAGGSFTGYNGQTGAPDGVLRLNADGTRDPSFNPSGSGVNGTVYALVAQPDGKVLVGGNFTSYNGQAAAPDYVLRLNADGTLDASFTGSGAGGVVLALAVQPDGRVLAGGNFTSYNSSAAAPDRLVRLTTTGALDPSFNNGGSGLDNFVRALAVQPDGQVLVGGSFTSYNGQAAAPDGVLRLNADGSLDATFNNGGAGASPEVVALAVQPDGRVLLGGSFTSYNGQAAATGVLRLTADGARDASFNPGGSGAGGSAVALAVQADGRVLVGGNFTSYNGQAAAPNYVLRLQADGTLDTGFNPSGSGADNAVAALAAQPDGRVLVGGSFSSYNGQATAPNYLLRLTASGTLNDAATPVAGATFVFSPGNTSGNTLTVVASGTYLATATDPATGCTYTSNAVAVTVDAPLPVTLTSFTAVAQPLGAQLSWSTASEQHSAYFAVERSADGQLFAEIGRVAAAGTSGQPRYYALLDTQPLAGATYYRLRQVDLDGSAHYSVVRVVAGPGTAGGLQLFPVPARTTATLLGAAPGALVRVFDTRGRLVAMAPADAAGTATLVLPAGLTSGLYVVRAAGQTARLLIE